jgi:hypothetical protein
MNTFEYKKWKSGVNSDFHLLLKIIAIEDLFVLLTVRNLDSKILDDAIRNFELID